MKVWLKSNDSRAADKVMQLLQQMEDLCKEGFTDAKPNVITYNTVIATLATSNQPDAASKAEAILDVMHQMSDAGMSDVSPDIVTYSSVIHCLSFSQDPASAERAEALLLRMEEAYRNGNDKLKPNAHSFTSVITVHTSKRTPEGAERAEAILNRMEQTQWVSPNNVTYSAVIDGWAKSGAKDAWKRAYSLLEYMKNQPNPNLKPTAFAYSSVLTALARSNEKGKAKKALSMLRNMEKESKVKPNLYVYNAVLSAAAYTTGEPSETFEALHVATMILEEGLSNAKPDDKTNITYGLFFAACRNLSNGNLDRVEKIVDDVISRCCEDGQFDQKMLSKIQMTATPALIEKYFGKRAENYKIRLSDCPPSWSRNARKSDVRRYKKS